MANKGGDEPPIFSDDVVRGAAALARHIYGPKGKRRSIYGMSEERKKQFGLFYDGKMLCGRKSVIDQVGQRKEAQ